jgi:hypothetical protein
MKITSQSVKDVSSRGLAPNSSIPTPLYLTDREKAQQVGITSSQQL